jgi:SRSO17 transposase
MCWRWPATIVSTSTPAAPATALTPWSARSRRGPGSRVSCGKGAKGHRLYDRAFIRLHHDDHDSDQAGRHWLLIRRHQRTRELAFYRCYTPQPTPLSTLVRAAGIRWTIEERFHTGKGLVGLDQHQVRRWRSWYRWVTLAMVAHALLVVAAVTQRRGHHHQPGWSG